MGLQEQNKDGILNKLSGRWLFFADTPVQVFNCIVLRNTLGDSVANADIAVLDQFSGFQDIVGRLEETGFFNNVYRLSTPPFKSKNERRLRTFAIYTKRRFVLSADYFLSQEYGVFALSCATLVTSELLGQLRKANSQIQTVFYEDGIGSYSGHVFRSITYLDDLPQGVSDNIKRVKVQKRIARLIARSRYYYRPCCIFVYEPELLLHYYSFESLSLGSPSNVMHILKRVFPTESFEPRAGSLPVIILDSVRGSGQQAIGEDAIPEAVDQLEGLPVDLFMRSHPRTTQPLKYDYAADITSGMWEMQCGQRWVDDAIIISSCSSGMLSPRIIYGYEPHLIFLYALSRHHSDDLSQVVETTSDLAIKLYRNKNRVHVLHTIEEISSVLMTIQNNRNVQ